MTSGIQEIIKRRQENIYPIIDKYLAGKKILDVGCGNGINSLLFQKRYGAQITLMDKEDIREGDTKSFPFVKSSIHKIPFDDKSFDIAYVQFVLHHIETEISLPASLMEIKRVAKTIIIVEELISEKTDEKKAREFDLKMNEQLHPAIDMPVFKFYTDESLKENFKRAGLKITEEKVFDEGSEENGFLIQKLFVLIPVSS